MDDFDAKNHILDMHRYAEQRQLQRLVEAGAKINQQKPAKQSVGNNTFNLLMTLNHWKRA
jgi:response regulator of citrate/malate metabolism